MSKNSLELKDFVNDPTFIENMNRAFSDLRADYELSMDSTCEKINELKSLHVDVKNHLSDLTSWSRNSSGVISGLRGTGKTHLFMLARSALNSTLWDAEKSHNLCIYLNLKRLCLPEQFDSDLFNRIFSVFIYDEVSKQLLQILSGLSEENKLKQFLSMFNTQKRKVKENLEKAILSLYEIKQIAYNGNERFSELSTGSLETESYDHLLDEFSTQLNESLTLTDAGFSFDINASSLEEISERLKTNNTYMQYLNVQSVRNQLNSIISLLKIDSITFYVDEWEKISYNPEIQKHAAFFIDRIIDTPLYFWISVVPYRGYLYNLDNGADLQHQINLDDSLIFEASPTDKVLCMNYFKELINNRLDYYFDNPQINFHLLFNNDANFEKLVLASMGNTRDFGTMLLKCWSEFQSYRNSPLVQGRPFKYISLQMVTSAIKDNGDKKISNLNSNENTLSVWNDILNFCLSKKSSHFAINESQTELECLRKQEFSDLIYHRLLHFRKAHVPTKDGVLTDKLSIYAINYACSYNLHSESKISFITEYKTIHDRVRRYIYHPSAILQKLQIKEGEIFPCSNCGEPINILKMKAAWDNNARPFCGQHIRH